MGQGLFDDVREYAAVEQEVDALVGYSVREQCLHDPDNRLNRTEYTQPCLYIVNALHYYKAIGTGVRPRFLAGHSLGEYNALLAGGAFDLVTGLRLVQRRGQLMAASGQGGLAAIIGLTAEEILPVLERHGLTGIDVANYNSPTQTVISGPREDLRRAAGAFEQAGAQMYVPLPVSAAFHSRYVAPAAQAFRTFLAAFSFNPLQVPVVANATGRPYPQEADATETVRGLLVQQITQAVRWTQSVRYLRACGVTDFREIGAGNVLTQLLRQTGSG
jgi:malonyl CoA-acyl carrier protein transacylase